jgi:hypothetical protein
VPGYHAPQETIAQASRPILVAVTILRDGVARAAIQVPTDRLPRPLRADVDAIGQVPGFDGLPAGLLARAMSVWPQLYGTISFELFGRHTNAVHDFDAFFDHQLRVMSRYLGLS